MRVGHTERPGKDENWQPQVSEVLGPLFEGFHPVLPDTTWDNFLAAFNKRCNYVDDSQAHPSIVLAATKLISELLPWQLPEIHWTGDLFEDWIRDCKFKPDKAKRLRNAVDKFGRFTPGEFGNKEVFTKVELLLKRHKPDWAGRIVNKSSDLHNAMSGPILHACLDRLKRVAESPHGQSKRVSYRLAYKGDEEAMTADMGVKGRYIECDFSENDMRQCSTAVEVEGLWLSQLGAPAWCVHVMRQASIYTAFNRKHNTSARLRHQLPSGSSSTTFRNSVWNMSIFYAFADKHRLKAKVLILGDDMLARILGRLFKRAEREYEYICKLARMKAKVKVHDYVCECEFLSRNFLPAGANSVFVPKLGKALARFNARANSNTGVTDEQYLAGKSLSYAYEFRHCEEIAVIFLRRFADFGISPDDIPLETLGYHAAMVAKGAESARTLLRSLRLSRKCSADEATQFYHFRYGLNLFEVVGLVEDVVNGADDIPVELAITLAVVDFL